MKKVVFCTRGLVIASLALALITLGGCAKKKGQQQIDPTLGSPGPSTTMESTTGTGLPELTGDELFQPGSQYGLMPVYFDYNSSSLRADARDTLKSNAEKIKQFQNVLIQVAGHCDERGTQEYNFALGERHALATRDYLTMLGISGDRIVTISYGEEMPAVDGTSEAAYALNRRCEFNRAR